MDRDVALEGDAHRHEDGGAHRHELEEGKRGGAIQYEVFKDSSYSNLISLYCVQGDPFACGKAYVDIKHSRNVEPT